VGLVGLALFTAAAISYLWVLRGYSAGRRTPLRQSALAAAGSFAAYLVYCSTDNSFDYVSQFGIYVFGLIAIAAKANQLASIGDEPVVQLHGQPTPFPNLIR
jgi:hypothetical protein